MTAGFAVLSCGSREVKAAVLRDVTLAGSAPRPRLEGWGGVGRPDAKADGQVVPLLPLGFACVNKM